MHTLKTVLLWLDENVEKTVIMVSYVIMASIVFVEVIRRMAFGLQAPWSTQVPIYLFLFLTWFSAAYNAKVRTHLSFAGLRARFAPFPKLCCHILDFVCWVILGIFVIYYTCEQVMINKENYSMVFGTALMAWYFMLSTPLGWIFILYRVTRNLAADIIAYSRGEELGGPGEFAGGDRS